MLLRIALRNLGANRLRLALTVLAVTLGASIVAGTLIFTATINTAVTDLFSQSGKGTDAVVRPKRALDADSAQSLDQSGTKPLPASLLTTVNGVEGVAKAHGSILGYAAVLHDGKLLGSTQVGQDWTDDPDFSIMHLTAGRAPTGATEVVTDAGTAKKAGFHVGDRVKVATRHPIETFTLVGTFDFGSTPPIGDTSYAAFAPGTAQRLLSERPGSYDEIAVHARDGVSQQQVRDAIAKAMPSGIEVITGRKAIDEQVNQAKDLITVLRSFLLAFAVVAVFVGSFIIFNTFSMLVAQRTRDLALLRAVGASRSQVKRSVLGEAAGVGFFGATLGIGLGCALAVGLRLLFRLFGLHLPEAPLSVPASAVLASYAVGIAGTVCASYLPAHRAATTPPVAAMREDFGAGDRSLRTRTAGGAAAALLGAAMEVGGLLVDGRTALFLAGGGAIGIMLGVTLLMPAVNRPLTTALGWPLARFGGVVGRLSRRNAQTNPRRTAATASALMIGLALVGLVSVIAASTVSSVTASLDAGVRADYEITSQGSMPFGRDVGDAVARASGVRKVVESRTARVRLGGETQSVTAADPQALAQLYRLRTEDGSATLGTDELLVDRSTAKDKGWHVGSTVPGQYEDGDTARFRIAGIYTDVKSLTATVPKLILSATGYRAHQQSDLIDRIDVITAHGADSAQDRHSLETALADWPNLRVQDRGELKKQAAGNATMLLPLILILLALSVVIAMLGIVNTLALSVIERTREIGLLRAVGMQRRQLRRMIRYESVVISVFGTVLGLGVGVVCGLALQRAMAGDGVEVLTVPFGQIGAYLLGGAFVGVVAAIWPARRAARMEVLRAIGGR
ncbi:ABC transporter permease [Streptomyces cyanogenus]|uniref:ABC transporter permease YtrF n=1 Tax=Streptomyces cyanogenus TaxID=80860 RepID=A0ABX7TMJ3_STRCY|nr:ABC transporter permease [Streptomyces cyanogenus]QTD96676.1 ABC transporter permease YtrF precursor [Streptomyces cyanogenus]